MDQPKLIDPNIEITPKIREVVQTSILPITVVFVLLLGVAMYMFLRPEPPTKKEGKDARPSQSITKEDENTANNWWLNDKYKDVKIAPDQVSNTPAGIERTEKALVTDQEVDFRQQSIKQDYALKFELVQLAKKEEYDAKVMEYAAAKSPLTLKVSSVPGKVSEDLMDSPTVQTNGPVNVKMSMPLGLNQESEGRQDINRQDAKEDFLRNGKQNEGYLSYAKEKPLSPYELKAGTYIPAALINGIYSDLPGPVTAQVTQNVYDTVSGNYLLIPQGSKMIGEYDSHVSFGQNRALVVWSKLIFPDGATLNLDRMQGVDVAGYAGFYDKVDNHYLRIYGNAFMLSLVGAGYELLNKRTSANTQASAQDTVAASVGQRLADVSSQTIERNMNVQPTIIIQPGYKFNVAVLRDIILENMNNDAP